MLINKITFSIPYGLLLGPGYSFLSVDMADLVYNCFFMLQLEVLIREPN
jgi:hypothetical protein